MCCIFFSIAVNTAELYDPATGQFTPTGALHLVSGSHTATLLPDGKVLVVGTSSEGELYDPATETFTDTSESPGVELQTATRLSDGTVLLTGGLEDTFTYSAQAHTYDSATGGFASAGNMATASAFHTATLLNTNEVLIVGGEGAYGGLTLARAETYDPTTREFAAAPDLAVARQRHSATRTNDGTVLIVGGFVSEDYLMLGSAELFNPATASFSGAGALGIARFGHTATLLTDGTILIIGGNSETADPLPSAELYAPPLPAPASLQIIPASATLHLGDARQLVAVDELGGQRFDAMWSVSDTNLATITPYSSPTLTARAYGNGDRHGND